MKAVLQGEVLPKTGHEFTKCGEAVSGEGVGGGIGRGRWEIGGIRGEK